MNFNILPKPPTSGDQREIYRWNYLVCELLNGLRSIFIDHDNTQGLALVNDTSTDNVHYKHITDAQAKVYGDHVRNTNGNPHGTNWDQIEETASQVPFNVTPVTIPTSVGSTYWDSVEGTLNTNMYNGATLNHGQELYFYGKASSAISNGDLCQFDGVQGDHIKFKKAVAADIIAMPHYLLGIATQNIANNDFGYVTSFGKVHDVFTTGWSLGDILYFDPTTGQLTNVMPALNILKRITAPTVIPVPVITAMSWEL